MKKKLSLIALIFVSIFGFGQTINQIGYYNANGLFGLSSKDNYMILSNGEIIDNSIPSMPVLISQYNFSGQGSTVLVSGDYAFFGTGSSNDLFIADISNISSPIHKSSIDFTIGDGLFGMGISENILFVTLGGGGTICSIDISDGSNPLLLDTLFIPGGQCRDIVTQNSYAFAAHDSGLKIIDITNASDIQIITSIGSGYNSIDMSESLVFLGKSSGGIDVFDISDPTNPSPAFTIPNSEGIAWDLNYFENHVYLTTNSNGLYIYKIEDNTGLEMANFPNTGNGQAFGVCLHDSLILLTGLMNGVAILQYDSLGTVGISNTPSINHFTIFPNPARDRISIHYTKPFIKMEIIDTKGKLVRSIDFNGSIEKLDISDLKPGQYIIRIETRDTIITEKFIKIE